MQTQPAQIGEDLLIGAGAVAGAVEIVDPQQPLATGKAGIKPAEQGSAQVAAVQRAGGGRCEAPAIAPTAGLEGRGEPGPQVSGEQPGNAQRGGLSRPAPCP